MSSHPVLVLNADYRPISLFPLSICSWQTAIKAMFLERVVAIAHYDREVSSPSLSLKIPSIIVLKSYIRPAIYPAFSRTSLLIRDKFACQYCGDEGFIPNVRDGVRLNMDHVIPRSRGGERCWENIVTSCHPCNLKKGAKLPEEAHMELFSEPHRPTSRELWRNSRELIPSGNIPEEWLEYIEPKR